MSSRSESVRGLMPGQACSSCMNRRGPSERSWTISGVHLVATISAVAATAQSWSWTSFMVRFMGRSLLVACGHSYPKESDLGEPADPAANEHTRRRRAGLRGARTLGGRVEPLADRGCALAALVDRPDDQRLAAARVSRREDAVDRGGIARRVR